MKLLSVAEMISTAPSCPVDGVSKPPHPDSLVPDKAAFCRLSAAEQLEVHEDARFEQRLHDAVSTRLAQGWSTERIERFVRVHRAKWYGREMVW